MALAEEQGSGVPDASPTGSFYTDNQGKVYEVWYNPMTGQKLNVYIGQSDTQSGTNVINDYRMKNPNGGQTSGGYGSGSGGGYPPPPPPSGGSAGGGYPQGSYVPPPPSSGSYGGGGGGGYAAGPTYANGQASRIPTGPPPPPPTTTGFPQSDWSRSMGGAIGNFDPSAVPPNMAIPRPLPSAGGIPQPGYKPSNLPAYQKKPGS